MKLFFKVSRPETVRRGDPDYALTRGRRRQPAEALPFRAIEARLIRIKKAKAKWCPILMTRTTSGVAIALRLARPRAGRQCPQGETETASAIRLLLDDGLEQGDVVLGLAAAEEVPAPAHGEHLVEVEPRGHQLVP